MSANGKLPLRSRARPSYCGPMQRPSSRLLVLDKDRRVLLFRFEHKKGALAGRTFWATPGGGVHEGENYEDAARRELFEEVGLKVEHPGPQIAKRTATFALASGEMVDADERYFVIAVDRHVVSNENWSDHEREVIIAHQWWSQTDLIDTSEQIWPDDLLDILVGVGVWSAAS